MTDTGKKILETFAQALPMLDDHEKEKLLSFGEGLAYFAQNRKDTEYQPPAERPGA